MCTCYTTFPGSTDSENRRPLTWTRDLSNDQNVKIHTQSITHTNTTDKKAAPHPTVHFSICTVALPHRHHKGTGYRPTLGIRCVCGGEVIYDTEGRERPIFSDRSPKTAGYKPQTCVGNSSLIRQNQKQERPLNV